MLPVRRLAPLAFRNVHRPRNHVLSFSTQVPKRPPPAPTSTTPTSSITPTSSPLTHGLSEDESKMSSNVSSKGKSTRNTIAGAVLGAVISVILFFVTNSGNLLSSHISDRVIDEYNVYIVISSDPSILEPKLSPYLKDRDDTPIAIEYKDSQFFSHIMEMIQGSVILIFGASNAGKSVFAQYVGRQCHENGDYVILLDNREGYTDLRHEIVKQLPNFDPHLSKMSDEDIFLKLIESRESQNQRVCVIIDNAQTLNSKSPGLGFLLNCTLKHGMGLVFVSSNDESNPEFKNSSGYDSRLEPIRFVSDIKPFKDALAKTGLGEAGVDTILAATGPNAGDIVKVMKRYNTTQNVEQAIASCINDSYNAIDSAVSAITTSTDALSDSTPTRSDACDLLSLATMDRENAVDLSARFNNDQYKLNRLLAVGEHLIKRNVLSRGKSCSRFVWRRQMLADAYKMNREEIEKKREGWWPFW